VRVLFLLFRRAIARSSCVRTLALRHLALQFPTSEKKPGPGMPSTLSRHLVPYPVTGAVAASRCLAAWALRHRPRVVGTSGTTPVLRIGAVCFLTADPALRAAYPLLCSHAGQPPYLPSPFSGTSCLSTTRCFSATYCALCCSSSSFLLSSSCLLFSHWLHFTFMCCMTHMPSPCVYLCLPVLGRTEDGRLEKKEGGRKRKGGTGKALVAGGGQGGPSHPPPPAVGRRCTICARRGGRAKGMLRRCAAAARLYVCRCPHLLRLRFGWAHDGPFSVNWASPRCSDGVKTLRFGALRHGNGQTRLDETYNAIFCAACCLRCLPSRSNGLIVSFRLSVRYFTISTKNALCARACAAAFAFRRWLRANAARTRRRTRDVGIV